MSGIVQARRRCLVGIKITHLLEDRTGCQSSFQVTLAILDGSQAPLGIPNQAQPSDAHEHAQFPICRGPQMRHLLAVFAAGPTTPCSGLVAKLEFSSSARHPEHVFMKPAFFGMIPVASACANAWMWTTRPSTIPIGLTLCPWGSAIQVKGIPAISRLASSARIPGLSAFWHSSLTSYSLSF